MAVYNTHAAFFVGITKRQLTDVRLRRRLDFEYVLMQPALKSNQNSLSNVKLDATV